MFSRKNKNPPILRRTPASMQSRQNVFSYYAKRSMSDSNKGRNDAAMQRAAAGRPWLRKAQNLPIILSVAVMVFAFLYSLTLNTNPIISIVDDSSTSLKQNAPVYQAHAAQLQKDSIFNQFKLTIDTAEMGQKMQQQFPELETAEVAIPVLGRRAKVELTTITPAFMLTTSSGKSYYIAADGRATLPITTYVAQPPNVIHIQDQSGLPIQPGAAVLTRDTVTFINQVIAQMKAANVVITAFELPNNPFELRMRIEAEQYYVKFHMLGDSRIQSGDFLAVKAHLTAEGQKPAEYIDARVEGKVFYK